MPTAAERARNQLDEVHVGYFPEVLDGVNERFDLICFNDVLEHMIDPWRALAAAGRWLAPEGRVLASIPNVRYGPHLQALMLGRWDYVETGILDRSHLRFFTRATMIEMFESAGYRIHTCVGVQSAWRREWRGVVRGARHPLSTGASRMAYTALRPLAVKVAPDIEWLQFVIVASVRVRW